MGGRDERGWPSRRVLSFRLARPLVHAWIARLRFGLLLSSLIDAIGIFSSQLSSSVSPLFQALNIFKLVDETSRGPRWDTARRLLPLPYFKHSSTSPSGRRIREVFSGESSWLNWRGPFGDFGQTACWWSGIYPACQMVDGPYGPVRESLKEPPRCIISRLSSEEEPKSVYSFEIFTNLLPTNRTTTFVGVRQLCRRFDGLPDFEGEGDGSRKKRGEEVVWGWNEISRENITRGRFEVSFLSLRSSFPLLPSSLDPNQSRVFFSPG